MTKSFVLYTRVHVEGDLVDCIYFINGQCWAQPFAELIGRTELGSARMAVGSDITFYKPTEEDQNMYCRDKLRFGGCPRFTAYQSHLRAIGLAK